MVWDFRLARQPAHYFHRMLLMCRVTSADYLIQLVLNAAIQVVNAYPKLAGVKVSLILDFAWQQVMLVASISWLVISCIKQLQPSDLRYRPVQS